ncbi:MAG: hypothetical protein DCC57_05865 [Chloroflexi bacterium]|nr:MAG: hypothetical protein DCC57_05865 [Chloroflexota bacterium]
MARHSQAALPRAGHPGPLPLSSSRRVDGGRRYTPFVLLGFAGWLLLLTVAVPVAEWPGMLVYLAIVVALAIVLYVKGIKPVDPGFSGALFTLAVLAKLIGSTVRYWILTDVYNSEGDALTYFGQGQVLAGYYRDLDFSVWTWYVHGGAGTTAMIKLVGLLYALLPANLPGSFFLYATLALAGAVFFYRATLISSADESYQTYRWFIFFLPSILFWPASLGKDAWIFFCSGVATYGWVLYARKQHIGGLFWAGLGLFLVNFIRPHTAAFLALAMAFSFLMTVTHRARSLAVWVVGGAVVAILVVVLVRSGAGFLRLENLSVEAVEEFYAEQQERTTGGGSSYETVNVFTPNGLAMGLVSALVRPFPWEAHNAQALIAALETMVWLGFCWLQRRAFFRNLRAIRSDPAVSYALAYSLIMLLALTSLGNFGLIARQRVVVLPFWWMLFL